MSSYIQPQEPVPLATITGLEKEQTEFVPVHLQPTSHNRNRPFSDPLPLGSDADFALPRRRAATQIVAAAGPAIDQRASAPDLPFSVWKRIAGNLGDKEVWKLRSLNRSFSNIAKAARYHTLTLGFDPRSIEESERKAVKVVRVLRDPRLAGLVRNVVLDISHGAKTAVGVTSSATSNDTIQSQHQPPSLRKVVSRIAYPIKRMDAHAHKQRNRDLITDVLGGLPNVQFIQIHSDIIPSRDVQEIRMVSNRAKSMLNALWAASGSVVRHIAVEVTLQTINVIPLDTLFLSNLKQISVTILSSEEEMRLRNTAASPRSDLADLFKDAINTNIAPLINNHSRQLTSLTINLGPTPQKSTVTTSTFIHDLRPFPSLQAFSVTIYSEDEGLTVHQFLGLHRGTLRRIDISLRNNATNALVAPVRTFEFPYPSLPHVHNIALRLLSPRTGPLDEALHRYIENYAPNLLSFRLINAFLTWEGFQGLVGCFPQEKRKLRHMYIDISSLSVKYFIILREQFPHLEDLHIRFANLAVPFFEGLNDFPDWRIGKLTLQMVPLRDDRVICEQKPGECRTKIIAATDHIEAASTAIQQRFPGIRDFSVVMPKGAATRAE